MTERRGMKGLEWWCKNATSGYPGVKVENMTTSWRDGLAFCAIIHHFRPDLIDFHKLDKDNIYQNNELAFRIAEHHLGIPALLEPEDMVQYEVPDRLSILTYLSQFYQAFAAREGANRITTKRLQTPPDEEIPTSSGPPPSKVVSLGPPRRREPCVKCHLPVYIAERLNVGHSLFHHSCFRCARCSTQLTPASFYETENGEYCCEICPDEEKNIKNEKKKSLEVKEEVGVADDYSEKFESALEAVRESTSAAYVTARRSEAFHKYKEEVLGDKTSDFPANNFNKLRFDNQLGSIENDDVTKEEEKKQLSVRDRLRLFENNVTSNSSRPFSYTRGPLDFSKINSPNSDETNKSDDLKIESFDTNIVPSPPHHKHSEDSKQEESISSIISNSVIVISSSDNNNTSEVKEMTNDDVITIETTSEDVSKAVVEEDDIKFIDDTEEKDISTTNEDIVVISDESVPDIISISDEKLEKSAETSQILTEEQQQTSDDINVQSTTTEEEDKKPVIIVEPKKIYPEDLNPFGDDDLQDDEKPKPPTRRKHTPTKSKDEPIPAIRSVIPQDYKSKNLEDYDVELNPFGDEDDDDVETPIPVSRNIPGIPTPKPRKKISLPAQMKQQRTGIEAHRLTIDPNTGAEIEIKRNLSKLEYDSMEDENNLELRNSVCRGRVSDSLPIPDITNYDKDLNPFGEDEEEEEDVKDSNNLSVETSMKFGSTSSISSGSHQGSARKKKPAPRPPIINISNDGSLTSSPSQSAVPSPSMTRKQHRKDRRAPPPPPPPLATSTPAMVRVQSGNGTQTVVVENGELSRFSHLNKSTHGRWKRKKSQAPALPIPEKRQIKPLPSSEIRRELELIETQQKGLERQGVKIEQLIRDKCEGDEAENGDDLPIEVEDMILQLFEIVNEKNELLRKQTELMYLKKERRLEEEHVEIEYQIRCLMAKPSHEKTDSDKAKEDELIEMLVEIVDRRNEIIKCLDRDRVKEADEDSYINNYANSYAANRDSKEEEPQKKQHTLKKKLKEKFKHKSKNKESKDGAMAGPSVWEEPKGGKKKKKIFNIF